MSDSPAFDAITDLKPDFFLNVGDLFYSATNKSTVDDFLYAYHELFKS